MHASLNGENVILSFVVSIPMVESMCMCVSVAVGVGASGWVGRCVCSLCIIPMFWRSIVWKSIGQNNT